MRGRFLLLVVTGWLGGCATALNEAATTGDGAVGHDTSTGDTGTDGTTPDAHDTTPIFETEGDVSDDARIDSSVADGGGDVATDVKSDSSTVDAKSDVGVDSGPTACVTSAPNVLFYTIGTKEQPYLPSGSVVTIATDASWRAMTTADFAKYQLIVIGDGGTTTGGASPWQTAFDTKGTWTPAVTGRVVVTTLDVATHAGYGTAGAKTLLTVALKWAASGPGTGLYIGPDLGWRKLDYLSGFGTFTALGMLSPDNVSGDDVHVTSGTHPVMAGSTDGSLSSWSISYHGAITGFPSAFTMLAAVTSSPTRGLVVARDMPCPP
jgi:hypothetical protein